ncbi:MAG: SGNH/GDSL hydrolase family protein [Sandaracinaceae bacterium]
MHHAVLALVLVVLTAPATAFATVDGEGEPTTSVMVIGDSHVERLGPMIDRAVRESGHVSLGYVARRGWSARRYVRADDMAERLSEHGRPDVVVVSLGGNDRCSNRIIYEKQLRWVVDQAHEAGATRIVWLGPATSDVEVSERAQSVGEWHEHNADWQSEILPELGVEWIDSRPMTLEGHGRDGIHFTIGAYRAWCQGALAQARLIDVGDREQSAVDA